MTIIQLKYVIAIAASASMREAADRLFVSQPALSATIRELEDELDIQLFERTSYGKQKRTFRERTGKIAVHIFFIFKPLDCIIYDVVAKWKGKDLQNLNLSVQIRSIPFYYRQEMIKCRSIV